MDNGAGDDNSKISSEYRHPTASQDKRAVVEEDDERGTEI